MSITNEFILARTLKEKSTFRTIQKSLSQLNILIRKMSPSNILYVCTQDHWNEKVHQYIVENKTFKLHSLHQPAIGNLLTQIQENINETISNLFHAQAITRTQYEHMIYHQPLTLSTIRQLYFNPILQEENKIILQPMVVSFMKEPIGIIANFVNILLEPLVEQIIHSERLSSAEQVVHALECYATQGFLRSTTLFVKIDFMNLATILPHQIMIEQLEKFLLMYVPNGQLNGISIETLIQFVQLILQNQYYLYNNQLYHQITGGPIQTILIRTLIDIYLFHLQANFVTILDKQQELFARSLDQLMFTWNHSQDDVIGMIQDYFLHPSTSFVLPIKTTIAQQISYLDVELSHQNGLLETRVYHNTYIEPHALPYPLEMKFISSPALLYREALIRAILYCSNMIEFENERLFLDLSFIINEICLDLLQRTFQNFLHEFQITYNEATILTELLYQELRKRLRSFSTQRQTNYLRQRQRRRRQRQKKIFQEYSSSSSE